jgi:hypothetical protein
VVNAITRTTAATAIANTSTVRDVLADNRTPRTIRVRATPPTTTAIAAIVTAPSGTPMRPSRALR